MTDEHKDADEIVTNKKTGKPVKAVYTWNKVVGGLRSYPAEFYFKRPLDAEEEK